MVSDFKDASCFLQAASKTKRQNITRPKAGWKDNLDNASKEVKKSGMAETATGAVLGEEYYIMDGSFLISFCSYELLILWFLVLIMPFRWASTWSIRGFIWGLIGRTDWGKECNRTYAKGKDGGARSYS